jgi:iron complex outermembrane receptor protein
MRAGKLIGKIGVGLAAALLAIGAHPGAAFAAPLPAIDLRYAGPRRTLMGNLVGGYALANLTLSARRLLHGLEASASAYNLFDKSYADPGGAEHVQDSLPQDGRSFRVKVTASF